MRQAVDPGRLPVPLLQLWTLISPPLQRECDTGFVSSLLCT